MRYDILRWLLLDVSGRTLFCLRNSFAQRHMLRWIYSTTLAYIVDANVGRSGTAVATNSAFRGLSAFVAAEVAVPIQDAIGDGGLYSIWTGLMVFAELLILLVIWKGKYWREKAIAREERTAEAKQKETAPQTPGAWGEKTSA